MNKSVRQRICEAVKERFESILTSTGPADPNGIRSTESGNYESNLGNQVFLWRATDISEAEIMAGPVCNISDTTEEISPLTAQTWMHTLSFECRIGVASNIETTDDRAASSRKVLQDITRAIGEDRYWTVADTRLAYDTRIQTAETGVDQQGRAFFVTLLKFQIMFRTAAFDPYSIV